MKVSPSNSSRLRATRYRAAVVCACTIAIALSSLAARETASTAKRDADVLAPFVDATTFLVLRIDAQRLTNPPLIQALNALPNSEANRSAWTANVGDQITTLKVMAAELPVYATLGVPLSNKVVLARAFRKATTKSKDDPVLTMLKQWPVRAELRDGYLTIVPSQYTAPTQKALNAAESRAVLEAALDPVADLPINLVLLPPKHIWRTIRELSPELPKQLGGGPSSVLTDGVQWISMGLDTKELKTLVVIQSANEEAATAFAKHLPKMLITAFEHSGYARKTIPQELIRQLINGVRPQARGNQVVIEMEGLERAGANLSFISNLAKMIQGRSRAQEATNNLKQIMLAMHNFHDVYGCFPPNKSQRDKSGKAKLLSWRVHLLPFLEQAALYDQFHLDEPWDSEHNIKLLPRMPAVFRGVATGDGMEPGYTTLLAPIGKGTIAGGDKSVSIRNIIDGTSNTIAVVEVTPKLAVPWTAPRDFEFEADNPLEGVLLGREGQWLAAIADGSIQWFSDKMDPEQVRRRYQMNDQKPVTR